MVDYTDLNTVQSLLKKAQEADHDNRERVREVSHFLDKDDGQWEPAIIQNMNGRPRYTFDKCNPVVDSISGEMEQADFDIRIRPAGGEATKETAKVYDGMIRNIENISNAVHVFNASGRRMVETGFDAWRVTQDWADSDSFEQDLFIRKIGNSVDRVWFDIGSEMQDRSDSKWAFVLQSIPIDEYREKWPKGSGTSVGEDNACNVYSHKAEVVNIGEFLWKEKTKKELVLMDNGKVYEVNNDFNKVADDLKRSGVNEVKRRFRDAVVCHTRLFDGGKWLNEAKATVFSWIPVVPTYGNFKLSENKIIYRGAINKLMDPQRVLNYALSRDIEEGALAPRGKYWMTREQAAKDTKALETMNTNADPVQLYTHVDGQNPPFWQGGAQVNTGLQTTAANMSNAITEGSAIFSANQGQGLANQSGVALETLQNKGDTSTIKWFKSQEVAICHTARILVDAIPRVYDTKRQIRILNEDGSFDIETVNGEVFDEQTGENVPLNDLRQGKYDVTCDVGPAFKNRQQETVKALTELLAIDPSLLSMGADVLLNNIASPGIDTIAERARAQMVNNGVIPLDQMTDEEKEQLQAKQQAQQEAAAQQGPDPVQQAILEQTQAQTADVISKAQERADKTDLAIEGLKLKQQEQFLKAAQVDNENEQTELKMVLDQQNAIIDQLKTQAETLKILREAQGVDVIVGPHTQEAFIQQAEIVTETQDGISPTLETQEVTDQITQ